MVMHMHAHHHHFGHRHHMRHWHHYGHGHHHKHHKHCNGKYMNMMRAPAASVTLQPDKFTISFAAPGVRSVDLRIVKVHGLYIAVRGSTGEYSIDQPIMLPATADIDKSSLQSVDGIVTIELPKKVAEDKEDKDSVVSSDLSSIDDDCHSGGKGGGCGKGRGGKGGKGCGKGHGNFGLLGRHGKGKGKGIGKGMGSGRGHGHGRHGRHGRGYGGAFGDDEAPPSEAPADEAASEAASETLAGQTRLAALRVSSPADAPLDSEAMEHVDNE